jgi:hypothetical protein
MSTKEANFDHTVRLLRGSYGNYLQTIMSFSVALVFTIWGILYDNDWSEDLKNFMMLTVFFMVFSVLVAGKNVRDCQMADLFNGDKFAIYNRGSGSYRVLVMLSAVISVIFPLQTIAKSGSSNMAFMTLGLFYLLSASLNLSKVVRDRTDASFFKDYEQYLEGDIDKIRKLSRGTIIFLLSNGLSTVGSVVFYLQGLWKLPLLSSERKFSMTVTLAFAIFGCVEISKFVRDLMIESLAKEISTGYKFMLPLFVLLSLILAYGSTYYYYSYNLIKPEEFKFIILGLSYCLSSVLSISKLMRDASEAKNKND